MAIFQGLKVDLANKQLTVDFVNQSAAQVSQAEPQKLQTEKMEFAEKLGVMNQRYVALSRYVTVDTNNSQKFRPCQASLNRTLSWEKIFKKLEVAVVSLFR